MAACCLLTSQSYDNPAALEAISAFPDFRCHLVPGCESGQIHYPGAEQPIMTRNTCGRKSCYTHESEWHEDLTCEDMDEKLAELRGKEIRANEKYMAEKTKPFPNEKCGKPIQKRGGCQHMTCKLFLI